jgi:hypothetical protein
MYAMMRDANERVRARCEGLGWRQEQFYLETQTSMVVPGENDEFTVRAHFFFLASSYPPSTSLLLPLSLQLRLFPSLPASLQLSRTLSPPFLRCPCAYVLAHSCTPRRRYTPPLRTPPRPPTSSPTSWASPRTASPARRAPHCALSPRQALPLLIRRRRASARFQCALLRCFLADVLPISF